MTSVTAVPRSMLQITYAPSDTGTYTIPYSESFSKAIIQVTEGNIAGDKISLYASFTPAVAATHVLVGEAADGTIPAADQLTGPGALFYTKGLAIPLIIAYTVKAPVANNMVIIIRMYNDNYLGTKTRA